MRFLGGNILRHRQHPQAARSCLRTGSLTHTPRGTARLCSHACLSAHLSQPRARVCTCTYPHAAPRAHAPPLSASCSPTGAHPLEAPAPASLLPLAHSGSLGSMGPSSRLICLLRHSRFRSLFLPQPCPFSCTLIDERAHSFPTILCPLPRPSAVHSPRRWCPFSAPLCVRAHTHARAFFFSLMHTVLHTWSLSFSALSIPLPCSFTCSHSPKHIYTFKLTLSPPPPPTMCRCSYLQETSQPR